MKFHILVEDKSKNLKPFLVLDSDGFIDDCDGTIIRDYSLTTKFGCVLRLILDKLFKRYLYVKYSI